MLPRSLAFRAFLLIALLILVSLAATLQLFRAAEREPRARQLAQMVVSVVNLTRAALLAADPDLRPALLAELAEEEGIRVLPVDRGERTEVLALDRPEVRRMTQAVRGQLGENTRFAAARDGVEGFWVSFFVGDDEFWVMMPRERIDRPRATQWIGWAALVLLLSLLGAWLIARQVGHPLRSLEAAARALGRGEAPIPVPESGTREVATVARAFNQMSADLASAERERSLVLAGISHDLRTPLARLRLGVELARDCDPKTAAEMIGDIEAMDTIVAQFLAYVRTDEGEPVLPDGDLNAIVRSVVDHLSRDGAAISLRLGNLPRLPLRPVAIKRLVTNLAENALRHGAQPVEIETGVNDGRALLRVMDRGPGIPETERERVRQPFARLDRARSTPGTGLGLAIVERIARAHGTRLELLEREGGGLVAQVAFPPS